MKTPSIRERFDFFQDLPIARTRLKQGVISPFDGLDKDELKGLLEDLGYKVKKGESVKDQRQQLPLLLEGKKRPPILLLKSDSLPDALKDYAVCCHEPLHDLTGMIQMILEELPKHIANKNLSDEVSKFRNQYLVNQSQIRGSDARKLLIRVCKLLEERKEDVEDDVYDVMHSLLHIMHLAYSRFESRCPKNVLRLLNLSFLFAICMKIVMGKPVTMSVRKLFGSYFHNISRHLGEQVRLVCLFSVAAERQEQMFGELKTIAKQNTNHRPNEVIPQILTRIKAKQTIESTNTKPRKLSTISREAGMLNKPESTVIGWKILSRFPSAVQAHLERIADYLNRGYGTWYHVDRRGLVFRDGPDDPKEHQSGPSLLHFQTSSYEDVSRSLCDEWKHVLVKLERGDLKLPISIRSYDQHGKLMKIIDASGIE